ncbi:MAG: hypothetical protein OXF73_12545 [Gammaproteobacteria bacterium]|nr:hypothetical protein [Gammaproteobacteria bacterium]MCY4227351.1 hypothetical protein [Gammaproteobacteria bacterium]
MALYTTPQLAGQLAERARCLMAAGTGPSLGLIVPIAAPAPVAGSLVADRGRTPAQLISDLADRVAQGLDLTSFITGQLAAAFAHDTSL